MSYIGKTPVIGNFVKLDAISVVNGQAGYTMQNGGANFTEYSNVNQFLVSLNGILQSPTTSFTVSSSTITFASNLVTGDVIDHIIVLGNTLDVGVPSDNTVSLAKLTATGTKDATTFLRGDNSFQAVPSGLSMADQWRLTADFASDAEITANLERTDTYGFGQLGTGMTESSGVFTFPSTGIYLIMYQGRILSNNYGNTTLSILITTDNSSYNYGGQATQGNDGTGDDGTATGVYIVDVTNTTNVKVKFRTNSFGGGSTLRGNTSRSDTCFTFIKLGDT